VHFVDRKFMQDEACEELNDQLERLESDAGKKQFLLNFENVEYLDSVALGMLCDFTMRVKLAQGTIKVCCLSPDLDMLLQLTRADRLFEIYADQDSALSSF
jgi:anti-sigma B factor antagonist